MACLQSMNTYQIQPKQHVSQALLAAVVGGGFNGKSTLLQAIEVGVYDKVRLPQQNTLFPTRKFSCVAHHLKAACDAQPTPHT